MAFPLNAQYWNKNAKRMLNTKSEVKNLLILLKELEVRNYVYLKFSTFAPFFKLFCVRKHFWELSLFFILVLS